MPDAQGFDYFDAGFSIDVDSTDTWAGGTYELTWTLPPPRAGGSWHAFEIAVLGWRCKNAAYNISAYVGGYHCYFNAQITIHGMPAEPAGGYMAVASNRQQDEYTDYGDGFEGGAVDIAIESGSAPWSNINDSLNQHALQFGGPFKATLSLQLNPIVANRYNTAYPTKRSDGKYQGETSGGFYNFRLRLQGGDAPVIYGCTNPKASNYNRAAAMDDGSCVYPPPPPPVYGCTNPKASNYNSSANIDDGSCVFPPSTPGCTDPKASNYNPNATVDDGSCVYPPPGGGGGKSLILGTALARDVSRRTIAVERDSGNADEMLLFLSTQNAGHSFGGYGIAGPAAATWPCLAVDKSIAKTIVFFATKQNTQNQTPPNVQYIQSIRTLGDGESGAGWVAQTVLWPGDYPALAAQGDRLALAYQDQGALKLRLSGDLGINWDGPEPVIAQFDGTVGGRVALAWVGEILCIAVPGPILTIYSNALDGWKQTGAPGDVPIQNLSLLSLPGVLLLLGTEGDGSTASPLMAVLRRSVDGGAQWTTEPNAPPSAYDCLGNVPELHRLLLGTTFHSDDDAQTWVQN